MKSLKTPTFSQLTDVAASIKKASDELQKSPARQQEIAQSEQFVALIRQITDAATRVETLLGLEKQLQRLDYQLAQTGADKNNIETARLEYRQLSVLVKEMRTNPKNYLVFSTAMKDTKGNPAKISPSLGLKHIRGNVMRLKARMSFAPAHTVEVWRARIAAAEKSEQLYGELHRQLAQVPTFAPESRKN